MLCDWSTYDTSNDVVSRDLVYTDGDIETTLGYYNPGHRYYYLSNQTTDEAWLMVQSDSVKGKGKLNCCIGVQVGLTDSFRRTSHCISKPLDRV